DLAAARQALAAAFCRPVGGQVQQDAVVGKGERLEGFGGQMGDRRYRANESGQGTVRYSGCLINCLQLAGEWRRDETTQPSRYSCGRRANRDAGVTPRAAGRRRTPCATACEGSGRQNFA